MRPEQKVPSLELCQKLRKYRITEGIETYWVWVIVPNMSELWSRERYIIEIEMKRFQEGFAYRNGYEILPAPDLSELGELFSSNIKYYSGELVCKEENGFAFCDTNALLKTIYADTEPNARAEMAIALYEAGVLK